MNSRIDRILIGAGPPALAAAAVGTYLALRSELPDRVASHFDFSGTPDDSMSTFEFLLATGTITAIGVVMCVGLALASSHVTDRGLAAVIGFSGGLFTGLGSAILLWTVWSQRGLDSWQDAAGPGVSLIWILGLGAGAGALAAWLGSRLVEHDDLDEAPAPVPAMDLAPGESAVFTRTERSRLFLWIGASSTALALVVWYLASWQFAIAPVVSAIATLALASLRVRVDGNGLRVKYGVLPWPTTNVPIERIVTASTIDVRPMQWGGWGYRGSLRLVNRAAVVHRAGPGLRLDLTGGKVLVVTVDDPEIPAAILNAELSRVPRPTGAG